MRATRRVTIAAFLTVLTICSLLLVVQAQVPTDPVDCKLQVHDVTDLACLRSSLDAMSLRTAIRQGFASGSCVRFHFSRLILGGNGNRAYFGSIVMGRPTSLAPVSTPQLAAQAKNISFFYTHDGSNTSIPPDVPPDSLVCQVEATSDTGTAAVIADVGSFEFLRYVLRQWPSQVLDELQNGPLRAMEVGHGPGGTLSPNHFEMRLVYEGGAQDIHLTVSGERTASGFGALAFKTD